MFETKKHSRVILQHSWTHGFSGIWASKQRQPSPCSINPGVVNPVHSSVIKGSPMKPWSGDRGWWVRSRVHSLRKEPFIEIDMSSLHKEYQRITKTGTDYWILSITISIWIHKEYQRLSKNSNKILICPPKMHPTSYTLSPPPQFLPLPPELLVARNQPAALRGKKRWGFEPIRVTSWDMEPGELWRSTPQNKAGLNNQNKGHCHFGVLGIHIYLYIEREIIFTINFYYCIHSWEVKHIGLWWIGSTPPPSRPVANKALAVASPTKNEFCEPWWWLPAYGGGGSFQYITIYDS